MRVPHPSGPASLHLAQETNVERNAFIETFNGRVQMECLEVEFYRRMAVAQSKLATRR